jgi:hypothetical protein
MNEENKIVSEVVAEVVESTEMVEEVIPPIEETFTFKVIAENKEDARFSTIEKHGQVIRFNLMDILQDEKVGVKKVLELTGQVKVEEAKITNIMEHNPFLKDLTEEQMHAVHMYYTSFSLSKICSNKIEEINTVLEKYVTLKKDIAEQTGIKAE